MKQWYKKSFGEDYLIVYQHKSLSEAEQEVAQLIEWLQIGAEDHILDLCCGSGRHTIALGKLGYSVIGLDLSKTLLSQAVKASEDLPVHFVLGDMRDLPFIDQSFQVVLNLFTSFGYFERDINNLAVLKEMKRVLKPKGLFCIDFLNPHYVRNHLVPESSRMIGNTLIHEERKIKGDLVIKTLKVKDEIGSERVYYERVKMYTKQEMVSMLEAVGLHVNQIFGDFLGSPFKKNSERMILIGKTGQ